MNPIETAAEMYMHEHRTWNIRATSDACFTPSLQIVIIHSLLSIIRLAVESFKHISLDRKSTRNLILLLLKWQFIIYSTIHKVMPGFSALSITKYSDKIHEQRLML